MHRGEKLGSQKLVLDTIRGWPSQLRFSTRTQLRFFDRFGENIEDERKVVCEQKETLRNFNFWAIFKIIRETLFFVRAESERCLFRRTTYVSSYFCSRNFLKNSRREERGRSSRRICGIFPVVWNIVGKNRGIRGVLQNWWHSSMIWSSDDKKEKEKSKETEELKYSISRTKKLINSYIFEYIPSRFVIFIL